MVIKLFQKYDDFDIARYFLSGKINYYLHGSEAPFDPTQKRPKNNLPNKV